MPRLIFAALFLFSSLFADPFGSISTFESKSQMLKGPIEEFEWIKQFPLQGYRIYSVPHLGDFFLENDPPDLIKDWLRAGLIWEGHLVPHIKKYVKPNTTVVDIGAHVGIHTLILSQLVGEQGRVIAIEPQMKLYSELCHNLLLNQCNNVTAYRCACGNEIKKIEMNRAVPGNEGDTEIGEGGDQAFLIPLDSLELNNVSFIKIDVKNCEDIVLLGMKETIKRNHPYILIEICGHYVPNRDSRVKNTITCLEKMGYDVVHFLRAHYFCIPHLWKS